MNQMKDAPRDGTPIIAKHADGNVVAVWGPNCWVKVIDESGDMSGGMLIGLEGWWPLTTPSGAVQEPVAWMDETGPGRPQTIPDWAKREGAFGEVKEGHYTIPLIRGDLPSPASQGVREALEWYASLKDLGDEIEVHDKDGFLTRLNTYAGRAVSALASLGPDSSNTPANKKDGEG